MFDFNEFLSSSKRIFTVAKKPDLEELKIIAKITGLGIIVIGFVGFVIMLLFKLLVR